MAFDDIAKGIKVEPGATERYTQLTALERQLDGTLYQDLQYSFEEEFDSNDDYVQTRKRRPSLKYGLPHLIFSQTQGELFGDEMFPQVQCFKKRDRVPDAEKALSDLMDTLGYDVLMPQIYEQGQPGSVAIVLRVTDKGRPYYDIQPGKYCEPVYLPADPTTMAALVITYPIGRKEIAAMYSPEELTTRGFDKNQTYWYRITIDATSEKRYHPLSAEEFKHLGEKNSDGSIVEFKLRDETEHAFERVPAAFVKNLIGKQKSIDGPATWWPIVDICVGVDYSLSQADRGLRYSADPMLFIKSGDLMDVSNSVPAGDESLGDVEALTDGDGGLVRGASQVLRGGANSDAKLVEMSGEGIKELREFVKQLREWALEVVGGMKSDAANEKAAQSGAALQQLRKPLMLLVARQRKAYGEGCLLQLLELTLDGIRKGIFEIDEFDVSEVAGDLRFKLDWPSDEQLLGQDLLYTVQGIQMAAGGTAKAPLELIPRDVAAKKLAGELGLTDPAEAVQDPQPLPQPADTGAPGGTPGGGPKE